MNVPAPGRSIDLVGSVRDCGLAQDEGDVPVVSVVMPVYHAARTVGAAVQSVLDQTFGAWELVIVDDGSTDETVQAIEAAARGDRRVRLRRQGHGGIVAALTHGIAAARGRLIARMDADDTMLPRRLEAQVAYLDARPEIGVVSCLVGFAGDPLAAQGYAEHVTWANGLVEPEAIALERFIDAPVAHPSVMFRRELLGEFGGYADGGEPEDYELWLRWMEAGVRFGKVSEVLLLWHDAPGRLSRVDHRYGDAAFARCRCRYLARWLRSHVPESRRRFLWGAGRVTRGRFAALADHGVRLAAYVDVDPRKIGTRVAGVPVIGPDALPDPGDAFIIGGVGVRGARAFQRTLLHARGYVEGRDFLFAA